MCLHRSYVVTEDMKVLSLPDNDHHTNIRVEYKIREDGFFHGKPNVSVEYRPVLDLFDLGGWECHVDEQTIPNWWSKKHKEAAHNKLFAEIKKFNAMDSTYIFPGNLDLSYLKRLPRNSTIVAAGCILLRSLDVLEEGTTIVAKRGRVDLGGLKMSNGGNVIAPELRLSPYVNSRSVNWVSERDRHYREAYEESSRRLYPPSDIATACIMAGMSSIKSSP